jgi:hypothetical protein
MSPRSKQKTKTRIHEERIPSFNKPLDRLRWIVDFAQDQSEPHDTLSIRNLIQALGNYLDGVTLCNSDRDNEGLGLLTYWDPEQSLDLPMRGEDSRKSWEDKLALVRSSVRKVLRDFLEPPQNAAFRLTAEIIQQRVWEEHQLKETLIAQDVREGVVFCLLSDLAAAGRVLLKCPAEKCPRMFVRQYRQNFCSTSCRNRTNFRAWYQRKKDGTDTKESIQKKEKLSVPSNQAGYHPVPGKEKKKRPAKSPH